jgi:hypothetical protein
MTAVRGPAGGGGGGCGGGGATSAKTSPDANTKNIRPKRNWRIGSKLLQLDKQKLVRPSEKD